MMNNRAAADFLALISNAKRLAILSMLPHGEMTAGPIRGQGFSQPVGAVAAPCEAAQRELVETRQQSTLFSYSCNSDAVRLSMTAYTTANGAA